jgi:hypothetical protein
MSERDPDDIVQLVTAPNPAQAHIWKQALRDEGIDCKVVGDYLNAGIGDVSGIQAEVWVHRHDLDKAKAVLEHHYHAPPEKTWEEERHKK